MQSSYLQVDDGSFDAKFKAMRLSRDKFCGILNPVEIKTEYLFDSKTVDKLYVKDYTGAISVLTASLDEEAVETEVLYAIRTYSRPCRQIQYNNQETHNKVQNGGELRMIYRIPLSDIIATDEGGGVFKQNVLGIVVSTDLKTAHNSTPLTSLDDCTKVVLERRASQQLYTRGVKVILNDKDSRIGTKYYFRVFDTIFHVKPISVNDAKEETKVPGLYIAGKNGVFKYECTLEDAVYNSTGDQSRDWYLYSTHEDASRHTNVSNSLKALSVKAEENKVKLQTELTERNHQRELESLDKKEVIDTSTHQNSLVKLDREDKSHGIKEEFSVRSHSRKDTTEGIGLATKIVAGSVGLVGSIAVVSKTLTNATSLAVTQGVVSSTAGITTPVIGTSIGLMVNKVSALTANVGLLGITSGLISGGVIGLGIGLGLAVGYGVCRVIGGALSKIGGFIRRLFG